MRVSPSVRTEYEKIGLLRFEHLEDSTVDPEPMAPAELIELLARIREPDAAAG